MRVRLGIALSIVLSVVTACADSDPAVDRDTEWGMEGPVDPTPPPGKEDSEYRRGLLVNTDTRRTQVWTAKNAWDDTTTTAARAAGLAWPATSGLTWDQKYGRWLASLEWIPTVDGHSQTVRLTTPWGKTLDAPSLECAETSLFLRITFAAWYELPLFFETVDGNGARVYFGHNGVRTASGRYAQTPEFAVRYADHSALTPAQYTAAWPSDAALRTKHVTGGDDSQPMLGGAPFGAYVDELHLNKRAAYFTVMALNYLGSMNLADSANTYNLVPDAVRPGDMLIERWQRSGIGHTLVVKDVTTLGEANLDLITISGSMPRRQGKRESGVASKSYFTSDYAGGPGTNSDGDAYARLGGGVKRFRVAKNIGGYWTNTWMRGDEAAWINSTDYTRIGARPARFEQLLGQVSPAQQQTELLAQIDDARRHLRSYPASCSARERREAAFADLYDLGERSLGLSRAKIDRRYRVLDDHVLAELGYARSKTCCWNSSTSTMYDVIMSYARAEQAAATAAGTCVAPTVFRAETTGYRRWADHATAMGQGASWRAWSEDESCPQRDVAADEIAANQAPAYCSLPQTPTCTDRYEPNDSQAAAPTVAVGTSADLRLCTGDADWYRVAAARTVRIRFSHAAGDLDLVAVDASGARVGSSDGVTDDERVTVPAGGAVQVLGYGGATGSYTLTIE